MTATKKLPYFRWHPKDFETDQNVKLMTMCEVGLYVMCLNHAWINGSLPNDVKKIAKIVGQPLAQVKKSWVAVSKCFEENSQSNLVNQKQEKERKWAQERHEKAKSANDIRNGKESSSKEGSRESLEALRAYGSGSISGSGFEDLETTTREETSTRARENPAPEPPKPAAELDEVYPEDPIETFMAQATTREKTPFSLKISRKESDPMRERLRSAEQKHGQSEFRCAWLGYLRFWKTERPREIEDPLPYFLASVERWIGYASNSAIPVSQSPPESQPRAPAAPQRDLPAEWNATVALMPYEWNGHAPRAALERCLAQEGFLGSWGDVCRLAQAIHQQRGPEASWLTLPYVLRQKPGEPPNWYRVLTEFRGMAEPPKAAPKEDNHQRILRVLKEQREAKHAAL